MEANLDLIGSFFAFDKDTGKIRHINDVQKGLECNCICPECHNLLIARKGKERTHHFAHASSSSGINELCSLGETIIHILGKEVIREAAVFIYLHKLIGIVIYAETYMQRIIFIRIFMS